MRSSGSRIPAAAVVFFGVSSCLLGQYAGPNINMVSGTKWPDGDPWLQRQNEPSIAISSRNGQHAFAGANDYRTVDMPGLPNGGEIGDAWLGVFKSLDGGQTWKSNLIPGYPQDTTPQGMSSPLRGMQAAADPVVRAGTNGLLYYAGMAFIRGTGNPGLVFVARYVDDNNEATDPIRYLGAAVLDTGNAGQFLDKPGMAVDIPRAGSGTCSVPGPKAGDAVQRFAAGNTYMAYARFVGQSKVQTNAQVYLSRSTDCGVTWSNPSKLSEGDKTAQGVAVAVDPRPGTAGGTVYVVWRAFAANGQPNSISIAKSTDGGRSFSKPATVATINPFDQGSAGANFRTTAFPALTVDSAGRVWVAWSHRGVGPAGDARIVFTTSSDGVNWNPLQTADPTPVRGHQIMPALSAAGGRPMLLYYDLRETHSQGLYSFGPDGRLNENRVTMGFDPADPNSVIQVFNNYVSDASYPSFSPSQLITRRHTVDVRYAQASSVLGFSPSIRVSQYLIGGTTPQDSQIRQLQFNPPNLPMFQKGTLPFLGDYISVEAQSIVPDGHGGWKFNEAPPSSVVVHAVWTDNRDVRPPADGDWTKYTPIKPATQASIFDPTSPAEVCNPFRAGMRNQNIYTSRILNGIIVGSAGNAKQLDARLTRAFSVFAQNTSGDYKTFRFTIANQPAGGSASFLQFPVAGSAFPLLYTDVSVAPYSGAARTVFATSTDPKAPIEVDVQEIAGIGTPQPVPNGVQGSVILNPDVTNPNISNPNISNAELYDPNISNPNISNPNISNPNISNPNISNPNISNPNISNATPVNTTVSALSITDPNISNPNISNPNISNPNISNPNISNPNISNPNISNNPPYDTTWGVSNGGNTAASYSLKLLTSGRVPPNTAFQAMVYRTQTTPNVQMDQLGNCQLGSESTAVPFTNLTQSVFADPRQVLQPSALDPNLSNLSVPVAAGETVYLTLRVYGTTVDQFNPTQQVTTIVQSQPLNTGQTQPVIVSSGPPVISTPSPLPNGLVGTQYSVPLQAVAGTGVLTWTANAALLPPGLILAPGGVISGNPTTSGTFTFNVTVSDSATPTPLSSSQGFSITIIGPPVITTAPALATATVNTPFQSQLGATPGAPGNVTWSAAPGALPTWLTLSPSGLLSGVPTTAGGPLSITITATNSANLATAQNFSVTVLPPAPTIVNAGPLPNATAGAHYAAAVQVADGLTPLALSAVSGVPAWLVLNPSTGALTGTPPSAADYQLVLMVTDNAGRSATANYSLTVWPPPPAVVQSALPAATLNVLYSATLQATNGSTPLSWSFDPATLPPGLSLSPAGLLSGTPTAAGPYSMAVTVTDHVGRTASASVPVTVLPPPPAINTLQALPDATAGVQYSVTLQASGGKGTLTWSADPNTLPAGLSLSSAGAITGAPSTAQTYSFAATVTDEASRSANATFTVRVLPPPPAVVTSSPLSDATVNSLYLVTLQAADGLTPLTWSANSAALPPGLGVSPAGVLTGTPTTTGPYSFSVTVTDQASRSANRTFSLRVLPPPPVIAGTLPIATAGMPYAAAVQVSNGLTPLTWSAVGAVPAWLTLSPSTGALTGLPPAAASYSLVFMVTDSAGRTTTANYSLTVLPPPPAITITALPGGTVGSSYSATPQATGYSALTWSADPNTPLPPGLSLSPAGAITGTPTTSGTYSFNVTVTDAYQRAVTQTISLTIVQTAAIMRFSRPTDTVSVSGQLPLANSSATYEARLLFIRQMGTFGGVFNSWASGAEDKNLRAGPGGAFAYSYGLDPDAIGGATPYAFNRWVHIAYVFDRANGQESFYIDGIRVAVRPASGSIGDSASAVAVLGAVFRDGGMSQGFTGYMDTLRISNTARYTGASFVPPSGKLGSDASTLLLYNFVDAPGSATITDSSGNGHTGTLGNGFAGATSPDIIDELMTTTVTPASGSPASASVVTTIYNYSGTPRSYQAVATVQNTCSNPSSIGSIPAQVPAGGSLTLTPLVFSPANCPGPQDVSVSASQNGVVTATASTRLDYGGLANGAPVCDAARATAVGSAEATAANRAVDCNDATAWTTNLPSGALTITLSTPRLLGGIRISSSSTPSANVVYEVSAGASLNSMTTIAGLVVPVGGTTSDYDILFPSPVMAQYIGIGASAFHAPVSITEVRIIPAPIPPSANFAGTTITNVNVANSGPSARVSAGSQFRVVFDYFINDVGCPGCIDQIEIGLNTNPSPEVCPYSGIPSIGGASQTGVSATLTAPMTPGIYYVGFDRSEDYGCKQYTPYWWDGQPGVGRLIGTILVRPRDDE